MTLLRAIRERPWLAAAVVAITGYLILFVALAVRRWMCFPPWSQACMVGFFQTVEAAVLFLWVEDREGLVGGLATFVGALVGAAAVLRVAQTGARSRERALRAGLALKLGPLLDYANASAEAVRALMPQTVNHLLPHTATLPPLPTLPQESVHGIVDLVAVSSGQNAAALADLLHDLQVQNARLTDLETNVPNPSHIVVMDTLQGRLAEAVALYASVSDLYLYARRKRDRLSRPLGADQAHSAISIFRMEDASEATAAHIVLRHFGLPLPGESER